MRVFKVRILSHHHCIIYLLPYITQLQPVKDFQVAKNNKICKCETSSFEKYFALYFLLQNPSFKT